jgi:hypothetical protein
MTDALISAAAAAQVQIIRLSLTGTSAGVCPGAEFAAPATVSWSVECQRAAQVLQQVGRGTSKQCTALVWRELDLATDLSTQCWWSSPGLQQAAVGEIAWTTAAGRWGSSVPSAAAQQQWEDSGALATIIQRQLAITTGRRRIRRRHRLDGVTRVSELRRRWEDAWWSWATAYELANLEGMAGWAINSRPRSAALGANVPTTPRAAQK